MSEIETIEKFFFNDEIHDTINQINNHLKPNNIFEITGMGSQEIKHSRILGWLMSSNHEIKDYFFVNFLKHAISFTEKQEYGFKPEKLKNLREYIYILPQKNLTVKFEYKNIDILVIDESNKYVFVIENKVGAQESEEQLAKYRVIVNEEFKDYEQFGIFLTADGSLPNESSEDGEKNLAFYLVAWYENIYFILKNILAKDNLHITNETRLIIENYIDLLLRRNIVENEEIEKICKKIWSNTEYKDALNILFNYKPSMYQDIIKYQEAKKIKFKTQTNGDVSNFFFSLDEELGIILRIAYSKNNGMSFAVCTSKEKTKSVLDKYKDMQIKLNGDTIKFFANGNQYKYDIISKWSKRYSDEDISDLSGFLDDIISAFKNGLSEN